MGSRLFAALLPDEAAINDLQRQIESTGTPGTRARPLPRENWHVTLVFLGEVERKRTRVLVDTLGTALASVPDFPLQVHRAGAFLEAGLPGRVWAGIHDATGHLGRLALVCRQAARQADISVSGRDFRPHLTIFRGRPDPAPEWFAAWQDYVGPRFWAGRVHILTSTLTSSGSHYSPMATIGLERQRTSRLRS